MGFTHNSIGEPCVVIKQPFIEPLRYATDEEIEYFLEERGVKDIIR
ncbi:MAG: hypothetical protein IJR84_10275 [Bacteroidaceae bacterium]|nr:hypothetical protein [Bacteroidaceae bacterium]MBQ8710333.1 hypothetical protein [Bacteroidaceae bacterium]